MYDNNTRLYRRTYSRNQYNNKKPPKFFLLIFVAIGIYFVILGIFPTYFEINSSAEAQIHRKSMLPPFKNIDIVVSNVKQAIIGQSRTSKGGTTYRVEIEDYNGKRTPITSYYSSGYNSKEFLKNNINRAIKDRTEYNHVIKQHGFKIVGLFFIIIPMLILFASKIQNNNTIEQSKLKQDQRNSLPNQVHQQTESDSEENKYDDINNSIIK